MKMKFETTKIGTVELEVTELSDEQILIDSWSLNQLAHSEELRNLGFEIDSYEFNYINASSATCTVIFKDNKGKLPPTTGEANRGNLKNDISKNLPHTMAMKRAIDQAIIKYLGINDGDGKRIYSNNEIEVDKSSLPNIIEPVAEIPYIPSEEEKMEEVETEVEEAEIPATTEAEETKENLLAYEIKAGVHKGKSIADLLEGKTIKEVCEVQKHYVPWLINNEPKREELIELKEKLIKLQEMEENNG